MNNSRNVFMVAMLLVAGCHRQESQSTPIPEENARACPLSEERFRSVCLIRDENLQVTLINNSTNDFLVEVPLMGIHYSLEYETRDSVSNAVPRTLNISLSGSHLVVVRGNPFSQGGTAESSLYVEIPRPHDAAKITQVKVFVRSINIQSLHLVTDIKSLEKCFIESELPYSPKLLEPKN